ncbi:MAG: 50S ribosomal protein L11 [Candidatus Pacearchaeota archaeon]
MEINLLVEGGKMEPGPSLAQKVGPMGLNMGQIVQQVNDATKQFEGMKVPVMLEVDPNTKEVEVNVYSPPASELLKKEFAIDKGSGMQKKVYTANASIEQMISIAKTKMPTLLDKELKSAVKSMVGTAGSLGIMIESKRAPEVEEEIDQGKYDEEIKNEKTETPEEKRKDLDQYYKKIEQQQQKYLQAQEEESSKKK